jgi:hypothetical protein
MRGYARVASVSLLVMGLLATPNLSSAKDGDGKHHLLNADVRSKIEHIRDRIEDRREHHHHNNEGGVPGAITVLQTEVANLKAALATANGQVSLLEGRLKTLEQKGAGGGTVDPVLVELAKYLKVEPGMLYGLKGPHVILRGANVHVQSGSNTTADVSGLTGLGNLIVGYNEVPVMSGGSRVGSHNLVVGPSHSFASTGGAVFGTDNLISNKYATILGGHRNTATGQASSVLGGFMVGVSSTEETYP